MLKLISFIEIERKQSKHIITSLKEISGIMKILTISGETDILIEIQVEDNDEAVLVIEKIEKIKGIIEIHSHFVMDEYIR